MANRPILFLTIILVFFIFSTVLFSQTSDTPDAKEFNIEDSDQKAVQIADQVMAALGGKENWHNTHYLTWNFFGRRRHIWDKWSGNLRLEDSDFTVLMNLNSRKGRVWKNGEEITQPDSLKKKLDNAYAKWINDSYWLLMPYKLKDGGVTLKYNGEGKTAKGEPADILQLTFDNVGLTPYNKYLVWVDKESHLVRQWQYFENASDEEPTMETPWDNWKQYEDILLSGDRGEKRKITDIAVFDELPARVFESPAPIDINELINR